MKKIITSLFIAAAFAVTAHAQLTLTISGHLLDPDGFPVPDGPQVLSIYTMTGAPEDLYGDGRAYVWHNASYSLQIGGSFSYHSNSVEAGFQTLPGFYGFLSLGLDNALLQETLLSSDPAVMDGNLLISYLDVTMFNEPNGLFVGDEIFSWAPDYYYIEGEFPQLPATSAVPEPSTYGLIGALALGAGVVVRRRLRR